MIKGSGNTFDASKLYKSNLANIEKKIYSFKNYKNECSPTLLQLQKCFDVNYTPGFLDTPIDGSEHVDMKHSLLAFCNFEYYQNCVKEDMERLNL